MQAHAAVITWSEGARECSARWRSESRPAPPVRITVADDRMPAAVAYRLASEGTGLLWRGDYRGARQLLSALGRRVDRRAGRRPPAGTPAEAFHRHRQERGHRARLLGMLLVPLEAGHALPLRRAPDVRAACTEAYGPQDAPSVTPLRELLGVVGAHEWRRKGVAIPALGGARVHPHYGVFPPVRGEYVDLVAAAPLPAPDGLTAFDVGTGTGVLAAVLARRGVRDLTATDTDPRALACARANLARLAPYARVLEADLFPPGRAGLVVCNPPWLPAKASSPLERAVYDPRGRMLRGFLAGLAGRLAPAGEGWLILSDLAVRLGLRPRAELPDLIAAAGLRIEGRLRTRPRHPRAADPGDPLHAARAAEVTSLWRLRAAG